jgi:hypothetical protein
MKLNKLQIIDEAICALANYGECDKGEIIDCLTGLVWDEEEAGEIKSFVIDAMDD